MNDQPNGGGDLLTERSPVPCEPDNRPGAGDSGYSGQRIDETFGDSPVVTFWDGPSAGVHVGRGYTRF